MQVLNLFYVVASMVSGLRLSHFFVFPDVYHLALARVETVICGPPALSPYLNFVCGTVDAVRPTVESSPVVVNLNFNIAAFDSAFPGLSVFDPSLVNCTLVDEPAPIYFGPHLPPADVIVAPKFALLSLQPQSPWDHSESGEPPIFNWLKSLLTWDNFVFLAAFVIVYYTLLYIVSCIAAIVRYVGSLICKLCLALKARLCPPTLSDLVDDIANGIFNVNTVDGPTLDFADLVYTEDVLVNLVAFVESIVPIVEDEVVPVAEEQVDDVIIVEEPEPVSAPIQEEVVADDEIPAAQDEEPCEDVAEAIASSIVDEVVEAVVDDDSLAHVSLPLVVDDIETELDSQDVPTVASVDEPSESSLPLASQVQEPMDVAPPSEVTPSPVASSSALPVDAPEVTEQPEQRPKKPVRCGKRLKMLRRKLAREAAEAEAAAQAEAQPAPVEAPLPVPPPAPPVEEQQIPFEQLTRQQKRAHRMVARAAQWAAGPSRAVREQPPRAPTPVFTDADFPPLPVEHIASRPQEHKMSYALITAISPLSKTAVVRPGSWTVKVNTDPEPELSGSKWIAASRRYEDFPSDSRWTNWKVDLEDIATFKPARKARRSKSD